MRYRLELSYDGSEYCGFQIQPKHTSVQETIELALSRLNKNKHIKLVGCGRTDSGVHAKFFVAHFDADWQEPLERIQFKLNKMLPSSIAILGIHETHANFHARFDANLRSYRYFVHQEKNPFLNASSCHYPYSLDIEAMNEAANYLIGQHDFSSFSRSRTQVSTNICFLKEAFWFQNGEQWVFQISANRFLRNMVRAIVGTLLQVGEHKLEIEQVKHILEAKDRNAAASSAPAEGLFLWDVRYN